jgi:hypothetical protein
MKKTPLSIIHLEDFSGFLNFEWIVLSKNIQMLKTVQSFLNSSFEEFARKNNITIQYPKLTEPELREAKKWFDPNTKHEDVKDSLLDLATKFISMNQEKIDIPKFIREMSLTYLVSNFENFFSNCLLHYYQLDPRALIRTPTRNQTKGEQDKKISYSTILLSKDQNSIITKLIQKELDIIMREDIARIIEYLERLLSSIKISDESDYSEFKEIFYRRNSIVHHRGNTNPDYNRKTKTEEKQKDIPIVEQETEELPIPLDSNDQYLNKSFDIISKYAQKIKTVMSEKIKDENPSS